MEKSNKDPNKDVFESLLWAPTESRDSNNFASSNKSLKTPNNIRCYSTKTFLISKTDIKEIIENL